MEPVFDLLNAPVQKLYGKKYDWWQLMAPARIDVFGQEFIIPAGYISDGASIPRWVPDWLLPRSGLSFMPSIGHDYLNAYALVPDDVLNLWYLDALKRVGLPRWQYELMFSFCDTYAIFRRGEELVKV